MRFISTIAAGAAILALCHATPQPSTYQLHEKRTLTRRASALAKRSRLDARAILPVRIGLSQTDLHRGYDWLMDVSHHESPNYGKHWTAEEVNKAFAPSAESVQAVRDWLIESGVADERITVSDNKGWLAFDATVEEAETLLKAEYYQHDHPTTPSKYKVGCDEYYLPEHVRQHVDYITPGVKDHVYKRAETGLSKQSLRPALGRAPPGVPVKIDTKTIPLNCSNFVIDADCIRGLYNMPAQDITRKISTTNVIGVFEEVDAYSQADLNAFFKTFAPYIPKGTRPDLNAVDGGVAPVAQAVDGGESMLDMSIIYSLIYPQTIELFQVDDTYEAEHTQGFGDTFLDALDGSFCSFSAFGQKGDNNTVDPVYPDPRKGGYKGPLQCGKYEPPNVMSISYLDGESNLPANYIERQCSEWMKLGLQGTTVLYASGDYGLAPFPNQYGNADGCLGNGTIFAPASFVDCPYVLAVGATQIKPNASGYAANPEEAVFTTFTGETLNYTSGGGFSNYFARPDYQKDAVANYFAVQDPPFPYYSTKNGADIGKNGGLYNRAGRGYPDVSANGAWWMDYVEGGLGRWGGTSMATPIWASLINIINEDRLAAGKSPVGFVNPVLYGNTYAFNDITEGFNNGCGLDVGFMTAPGWDPVTGLGTPNFKKLKQLFMSLP